MRRPLVDARYRRRDVERGCEGILSCSRRVGTARGRRNLSGVEVISARASHRSNAGRQPLDRRHLARRRVGDGARRYDGEVQADQFAAAYPPAAPIATGNNADDAARRLSEEDGVRTMPCATEMRPAARPGDPNDARHLWVILADSVPVILETAPDVRPPPLSLGVAKHTNLTGGDPACCGGEIWLDGADSNQLYVNGGSGRYPARTPEQLDDAVRVFEGFGYSVRSAGWSYENDWPERTFR